jgi:archaeal flagellar protein FlaJ
MVNKYKFRMPMSFLPMPALDRISNRFLQFASHLLEKNKKFGMYIEQSDLEIKPEKYLALCITSLIFNFIFLTILAIILFYVFYVKIWYAPIITLVISFIIYWQQTNYPRLVTMRRMYNIERNLLPAMRAMLIQLNAGVTFYDALKNISQADYGLISEEFQKAVAAIESGAHAIDALELISRNNPSVFFRRAIWQIITGMQVGSEINSVLKEIVSSMLTEQITEIQSYGGRLSPMSMFYMVIAVIFPALSVTFIIVIASFMPVFSTSYKTILIGIISIILVLQIVFLGMIKSRRPSLV